MKKAKHSISAIKVLFKMFILFLVGCVGVVVLLVTLVIGIAVLEFSFPNNFQEYGPTIGFNSRDCKKFDTKCASIGASVLTNSTFFPETFEEAMRKQLKHSYNKNKGHSQNVEDWECMVEGRVITDKTEELIVRYGLNARQVHYDCWLK